MKSQPFSSMQCAYSAMNIFNSFPCISTVDAYISWLLSWSFTTSLNIIGNFSNKLKIAFCPFDVAVKRLASMYTPTLIQNTIVEVSHCNLNTTITSNLPYPFTLIPNAGGIPPDNTTTVTFF